MMGLKDDGQQKAQCELVEAVATNRKSLRGQRSAFDPPLFEGSRLAYRSSPARSAERTQGKGEAIPKAKRRPVGDSQ
jgi:hypothetical protein